MPIIQDNRDEYASAADCNWDVGPLFADRWRATGWDVARLSRQTVRPKPRCAEID